MISIIIPTLNEEKVIGTTLQNIRHNLNNADIAAEIIVSDGNSTDQTIQIAQQYADKVIVYKGEKRQTIAQGRNDGARHAQGDFLVFFDADCSIKDPDFFTKALENFKDPRMVNVIPWLKVLPEKENLMDWIIFSLLNAYYVFLNNAMRIGIAGGEFQMIPRAVFNKNNGFNENLIVAEDVDLIYRLSKNGLTRLDPSLVVFHTGRRAHKIGWPRLLWSWWMNTFWLIFNKKPPITEWEVIR